MRATFILSAMLLLSVVGAAARLPYPPAPRGTVSDTYFGTTVADPYRWMENIDSPQTSAWVAAEGAATRSYLDHNVKASTAYPPTLIMKADHDDRVFPAHSFKFAAAMQHAQTGDAPILLRVESKAGHGGGTPTSKAIEEAADRYAFLVKNLGM